MVPLVTLFCQSAAGTYCPGAQPFKIGKSLVHVGPKGCQCQRSHEKLLPFGVKKRKFRTCSVECPFLCLDLPFGSEEKAEVILL